MKKQKLLINPDDSVVRIYRDREMEIYKVGIKGEGFDYYRSKSEAIKAYIYLQGQEKRGRLDLEELKRLR